jgi:selenide, water dikinase
MELTTECGGCAAKASPQALAALLHSLKGSAAAAATLVGLDDADDAAVIQLDAERALVTTIDACPPMVEDPWTFGAIAAANAVGDVLAMGGRVLSAVALVAFPRDVDPQVMGEVLSGAQGVVEQCGGTIVGGHTVHGEGVLFGLAVTGMVAPQAIWRIRGAKPGDFIVLSRPIGVGLVTSHGSDSERGPAVSQMSTPVLEDAATLAALGHRVHSVTDVTGYGLLGHALDLVDDGLCLVLDPTTIPVLPTAMDLARAGKRTTAHRTNLAAVEGMVDWGAFGDDAWRALLVDPQTTGGLLAAVSPDSSPEDFQVIGQVVERGAAVQRLRLRSGLAKEAGTG